MHHTSKNSVCLLTAFLALQPFVLAQTAAPKADAAAPAPADASADKAGLYSNEKTDFDGQNRPIKVVIKEVADLFGFNVNVPDELDGTVPDAYKQIRWQDFFSIILAKKGYLFRIDNDIVIIEKKKSDLRDKIKKLESGNISVDFDKVPVADAVTAICEVMEKNYSPLPPELESAAPAAPGTPAASPKVISIKLKGVSWQRTLSEILARFGYGFKDDEGIIRVLPLEVLNNVPSETRVYKVNFADATAVASTINSVFRGASVPAGPGASGAALLSATAETTQQLVIVTAKPDFLRSSESNILAMISQIDQPSKQVIIESKIIERTWNNNFELGFRYAYGPGAGSSTGTVTTNGATAAGQGNNVSSSAATAGLLTSSGNSGTAPFSFVLSEKDFKFFMDALETDKTANVLQNPTLVVKDDGKGAIRIIRRTPYFETSSQASQSATTISVTTKFINIGTSLYIKPKIKGNGYVELKIDQAEAGGPLTGGGAGETTEGNGGLSVTAQFDRVQAPSAAGTVANFVPVTDNRDIRTTVLLRDGYTVGLGGLVKDNDNKGNTQVPILGDIPVLGRLFQSQETAKEKLNLMAFITARIIDPYNANYRDMLGLERVRDLGLSSREIEGGSYKISESEREALDELLHKADLDANAAKAAANNRELNGTSN